MNSMVDLIRPEIRKMRPYRSAEFVTGLIRLNANETPWRPPADPTSYGLNWYPEPRPFALGALLAAHYGVAPGQVMVTRGSSEAIDVLIRGFCRSGQDDIIICPPTFGMYETYAQIQGAGVVPVPLLREQGFALDVDSIISHWNARSRLVFVCSPNNPTGNQVPEDAIARLADAIGNRGVIVLDAAYAEFSDDDPSVRLLGRHENMVVLRTLSKAMGLAGVRCGVLLGPTSVVDVLGCVLPPFCFPTLSVEAVTRSLDRTYEAERIRRITVLKSERARLAATLAGIPSILRVWASEANFLLVETSNARELVAAARSGGVLVRDFSWDPYMPKCVRITIGDREQNDQLLRALE